MTQKSSDDTLACICKGDQIDLSEIEQIINGITKNLKRIKNNLSKSTNKCCGDDTERFCKLQTSLAQLISNDDLLQSLLESLTDEEPLKDDLASNFGISVKVDMASERLEAAKTKHDALRTEWYSQDKHLNRLANKVEAKNIELERQSMFCTTQGLVLSTLIWKASHSDDLLDFIVAHQTQTLELINLLDKCLYGFIQTYKNEMPEPSAEEYQYVLCLCGILSNLAAVPDGRYLLCNNEISQGIFNQIIKMLPSILVPKAEGLKWIMLSAIYNIMICKEGEKFIKNNPEAIKNISSCTMPPHNTRIIILGLKIISKITNEIPNQAYLQHVSSSLPIKHFKSLQKAKDSLTIRKQAKSILGSISRVCEYYSNLAKEEKVTNIKSQKCTVAQNKKPVMAYYVFTDTTKSSKEDTYESTYYTSCTSHTSSRSMSASTASSMTTSDTDSSSSDENVSSNDVTETRTSSCKKKLQLNLCKKTVSAKEPSTSQNDTECQTLSTIPSSNEPLPDPATVVSSEIQTIQFQNIGSNCDAPVVIGDHPEVIALPDVAITSRIAAQRRNEFGNDPCASIVTVFRANNSLDQEASSNSFGTFITGIGTSTSFSANVTHVVGTTELTDREATVAASSTTVAHPANTSKPQDKL